MSDRVVGQTDRTLAAWYSGGVLQMDGQAFAWYTRVRAGLLEYLQGSATVDNGTWSTTYHEFDLAPAADGFERFFLWPASSLGYAVTEHARSSVHGIGRTTAEHVVGLPPGIAVKLLKNKLVVDALGVARLYDDDGTTVLYSWQLNKVDGMPATPNTDVFQRIPL